MKQLRIFAVLLMLVSLASLSTALAQPQFEMPLTVNDGVELPSTLYFGILPTANFCIVPADILNGHQETMEPPLPAGGFYTKLVWPRSGSNAACFDLGSKVDFRPFTAYAQKDTFKFYAMTDGTTMGLTWNHADVANFLSATLRFTGSGGPVNIDMLTVNAADITDGLQGGTAMNFTIFTDGLAIPPSPPPIFAAAPATMNFGGHPVGTNTTQTLTISNAGAGAPLTDLILDPAPTTPAGYTITPNPPTTYPINIAPGASYNFDVTFSPVLGGTFNGNITFTHNGIAPGPISPTDIPVTGSAFANALQFASDARTHLENLVSYVDTLRLVLQGADNLKALQVRLVMKGNGTSGLSMQSVSRGSDLPAGTFSFATQIHFGPPNGDGTTDDTMSIVFYGNANNSIAAGTYNDLIRFRYGVGHVTPNGTQLVHTELLDLRATKINGDQLTVSADDPQNVTIEPRGYTGYQWGDVDTSGTVDILDLLAIVDYILGRNPSPFNFALANIAPWNSGDPAPTPDTEVNVQDLAVVQTIILTGYYPDGTPVNAGDMQSMAGNIPGLSKGTSLPDVKLTVYVNSTGISLRMVNRVPVKGLQLHFGNVPSVPSTMRITTLLGDGYYYDAENLLRVLMYDMQARTVPAGDHLVGDMPFPIANPETVTLNFYLVASELNKKIENVEIEIINGNAPGIPVDFALYQNYPNPFNPTTSVTFSVPQPGDVTIAIFNVLGQEVQTLYTGPTERGTKIVEWNGLDRNGSLVPSGVYVYRMTAGSFVQSRKMMFLK